MIRGSGGGFSLCMLGCTVWPQEYKLDSRRLLFDLSLVSMFNSVCFSKLKTLIEFN